MIRTISFFVFLIICNSAFSATAMKDSDDAASSSDASDFVYTQKAQELIPDSQEYPTQEQIEEAFQEYVHASIYAKWVQITIMMFTQFAQPAHPAQRVIQGWRCLLVKVMKAQDAPNTQWEALLDLLKLHEKSLKKLNKNPTWGSVAQELQYAIATRPGCATCAKKRLGADGFLN